MRTAKIGAIFLISVMALAGIGAGYAAWFDTITISGTVNTGDVNLEIVELSETLVYKDLDNDGIVICHRYHNLRPITGIGWSVKTIPAPPTNGLLVASATATSQADDEVTVTFDNLFPCIEFYVDILFHYDGSIPVKVNYADFIEVTGDAEDVQLLTLLWNLGYIWVEAYRADANGVPIDENKNGIPDEIVDVGTQLHNCDYVILYLYIHLPQYWPDDDNNPWPGQPTDNLMNIGGSFTGMIEVVQWNEFPYTNNAAAP